MTAGGGKIAVVTGAAKGIGEGIARVLAGVGWTVVACDIDEDGAELVATEIGGLAVTFDLGDQDAVEHAAASILDRAGGCDALVNNAAWEKIMPFERTDRQLRDRIIAVNLVGPMTLTHGLLPAIKERHGRIVNIASAAGRMGAPWEVVYSTTKGGLISFTRALARECAAAKVTVNTVCPGPTDTPLYRQMIESNPDAIKVIERVTPLAGPYGRIGTTEEIGHAVEYLLSDRAAWVTGQTISVDGGMFIG
jgi:2-hydroxycyclohexanecarboxyl-CoA dehydrogenase